MCCLELEPIRGGEHFKPRPQNRIPLGGSFQNFWRKPPSFYMGVSSLRAVDTTRLSATTLGQLRVRQILGNQQEHFQKTSWCLQDKTLTIPDSTTPA